MWGCEISIHSIENYTKKQGWHFDIIKIQWIYHLWNALFKCIHQGFPRLQSAVIYILHCHCVGNEETVEGDWETPLSRGFHSYFLCSSPIFCGWKELTAWPQRVRLCAGGYIVNTLLLQLQFKREIINILSSCPCESRAQTPKEPALFCGCCIPSCRLYYVASRDSDPLSIFPTYDALNEGFSV